MREDVVTRKGERQGAVEVMSPTQKTEVRICHPGHVIYRNSSLESPLCFPSLCTGCGAGGRGEGAGLFHSCPSPASSSICILHLLGLVCLMVAGCIVPAWAEWGFQCPSSLLAFPTDWGKWQVQVLHS